MREREEACHFIENQDLSAVVTVVNTIVIQLVFTSVQVVEELLSRSGSLEKETAKSIADAAMLEVASISMGHMVRQL